MAADCACCEAPALDGLGIMPGEPMRYLEFCSRCFDEGCSDDAGNWVTNIHDGLVRWVPYPGDEARVGLQLCGGGDV